MTQNNISKKIEENNLDINEKINKQTQEKEEKIKKFFDKIDFLEMPPEQKADIAIKVKNDAAGDKLYWIEIILSGLIAALGLLINSVAVIIGAMLIAPLLRPMNGISFAIAMGERKFFWKSLKVMFLSVILSIATGFVAIKISGLNIETSEILSRTSANLIDLFIAIFSAMVAVLSLRFERLGESVAGVAMAAALMPPLAVVGIEFALGNYELSFGALTLFFANLISIVLVGILFFWMYGFNPNNGEKQKSVFTRMFFVIFTIILISIPLANSLYKIKEKINISNITKNYLKEKLNSKTKNYKINSLEVTKITDKKIVIQASISVPENLKFYETFKNNLIKNLSKKINKDIELNIELIKTVNFLSEKDKKIDKQKELFDNLENKLNKKLEEKNKTDREYLKKEILDEIKKIFKEQNLKVVKIEDLKKLKNNSGSLEKNPK